MQKILVVVAHPDDEILGMGGTIAKLSAKGKEVHVLIVTDGSSAQYRDSADLQKIIEDKKLETLNACKRVCVKSIHYGGMSDMRLDVTPHIQVNQAIEKVIDVIQPDTVFTHFYGDVNLDHQCVFKSVMVAVRPVADQVVKEVYCFNVPSSTEWNVFNASTMFMPNMVVNISDYAEQKYAALAEYKTELRDFPHPRSIEHIRKQDEAEGLKAGLLSAESFMLIRKVVR